MTGKRNKLALIYKYVLHITIGLHILVLLIFIILRLEKGFSLSSKKYIIQFTKEDKSSVEKIKDKLKYDPELIKKQANSELKKLYSTMPEASETITNMDENLNEISATIEKHETEVKSNISIKKPIENLNIKKDNYTTLPKKKKNTSSRISLISINLDDRFRVFTETPVFKCKDGGKVIVNIKVNREGTVIAANVAELDNKVSKCILNAAYHAAINTVFNRDKNAPKAQVGNIVYHFIKQ